MVEIINKDEFNQKRLAYIKKLPELVFVYPTDTIYGIGCDATNESLVRRIREIKGNNEHPFSVIAPSKSWVEENCEINDIAMQWMDKLPGPYTLIIRLKNQSCVAPSVILGKTTIGIRIPDNWIAKVVEEMQVPVITTSANKAGEDFMTKIENLDASVKESADIIIYDGPIIGKPSTLVIIDQDKVKIHER